MNIIAIGDIHGRNIWKQIVTNHLETIDKIIFIGDYVDSFNISAQDQLNNLADIIELKKQNPDKIILLIGNHDYQYWPGSPDMGTYSGFQYHMLMSYQTLFQENKKLFQMCYEFDNIIFSHAGFTETFVERKIGSFSEQNVNDIFKYKPQSFKFSEFDRSGCGDSIEQSCIWVRPRSLEKDYLGNNKIQVIGHTHTGKGVKITDKLIMIDCLDTSNEYLFKDNNGFKVLSV